MTDIFRSAEYARAASTASISDMTAACLTGKCNCESANSCKLARCNNCDYPIDRKSRQTLVDHWSDESEVCPDCNGPLNDKRIYGAL